MPAVPVIFDAFSGTFQPSAASRHPPLLMLSPIGYEELCSRTFFTRLSERLAGRGIASLRFDYPGTADALDGDPDGLGDWRLAVKAAAARLRDLTGQATLSVLGQGLGALLALEWAAELGPLDAVVLLDPPGSGRAYLRGLKAWGSLIASSIGLAPDEGEAGVLSVAGMIVPDARAVAIRKLDPARLGPAPMAAALLLSRPGSAAASRPLVERLGTEGVEVTQREFAGCDALLTDPTSAVVPEAAVELVAGWLAERRSRAPTWSAPRRAQADDRLRGAGFTERPIRFGTGGRLAGVVCEPAEPSQRRAVVLVNAGRDYHIGWGRSSVLQARALARAGVTSLRFDISGVGDSRPKATPDAEILYSSQQCDDLRAAIDWMTAAGFISVGLVGRCSGGWAAFTVAVDDPRVDALALMNVGYFIWDGTKTLADVVRFSQRTIGDLGATFLKRAGLRRLLAGELDVRGALRFLGRQANLRLVRPAAPFLGGLTPESRRFHDLHRLFGRLNLRGVRVELVYSEGDGSLGELRSFMGARLLRLPRYANIAVHEIAKADHNFTREAAQTAVRDRIVAFFATPRSAQPRRIADGSAAVRMDVVDA